MDRVGDTTPSAVNSKILPVGSKSSELANDSTRRSTDSVSTLTGVGTSTDDDEKEKVIAKAALSIAELGMLDLHRIIIEGRGTDLTLRFASVSIGASYALGRSSISRQRVVNHPVIIDQSGLNIPSLRRIGSRTRDI